MNINKVIRIEIEKFKKKSDSIVLAVAEEFQSTVEKQINECMSKVENDINSVYATGVIDDDIMQGVYDGLIEINSELEDFKKFCDPFVDCALRKNKADNHSIIDEFISSLLERGICDRNRIILEVRKISHYQVVRLAEHLNMVVDYVYELAVKKLSMNVDLFNDLVDKIEEQENEEYVSDENIDSNNSLRKEKITDVKRMIEVVMDNGYSEIRQTGSHKIFKNDNGKIVTVPYHTNKDFHTGLGYAIQKQVVKHNTLND